MNWTPSAQERLRAMYPDTSNREIATELGCSYSAVKNRAQLLGLKKSRAYLEREKPGQFGQNQEPWNKGKAWVAGGRSGETRLKAGQRPANEQPVGAEIIDCYGYRKRKVSDTAPKGRSYRNWQFVHILVWEEHNGPLPECCVVRFRDGDKTNLAPDNLTAVTRAENGIINKMYKTDGLPAEGFDVMLNLARIKIIEKQRKKELSHG